MRYWMTSGNRTWHFKSYKACPDFPENSYGCSCLCSENGENAVVFVLNNMQEQLPCNIKVSRLLKIRETNTIFTITRTKRSSSFYQDEDPTKWRFRGRFRRAKSRFYRHQTKNWESKELDALWRRYFVSSKRSYQIFLERKGGRDSPQTAKELIVS